MTHPDTLQIPRAVVKQALEAMEQFASLPGVGNIGWNGMTAIKNLRAALQAQAAAPQCVGKDPLCPCPDGDACHYEGKDAWPVPEPLIPFKHGCKWCGKAKCVEGCPGIQATPPAHTEAMRLALEALRQPCDRWNKTQTEIVNAAIAALEGAMK